jgi:hypothetical protein
LPRPGGRALVRCRACRRRRDLRRGAPYLSLDASGTFALSSAACFADAVGRAAELGFTDVFTHWPRPSGWYAGDESVLETVVADFVAASR